MTENNFEMKSIGIEHLDQYNELLKYVFQVTENDIYEHGWDEEEDFIRAKAPNLAKADAIGWFDKENLISQVIVYPMKVRVFSKTYKMGGLTGVGTYPEYANHGLMHKLLVQALTNMREKGQYISYLFPYSIPYYRRKGWEIISDKITYEIKDYQLPKDSDVRGKVRRFNSDNEAIKELYNRFAHKTHGALIRDDISWNEYWLWESDDTSVAIYYDDEDKSQGYLVYHIAEEVFHIKEMVFLTEEARRGLWNFVTAHFSMIVKVIGKTYTDEPLSFLLEDADIKEIISPYYMARIVDFEKFIEEYPFKKSKEERKWTFNLEDPLLPWNRDTFELTIDKDGKGKVKPTDEKVNDSIDIQTMTTMLLSYKRPTYLNRIGRINCDEETVEILEKSIEQNMPYFSDYF